MKRFVFSAVFLILSTFGFVISENVPVGRTSGVPRPRSLAPEEFPVEVTTDGSDLLVSFTDDVGVATVTVSDQSGVLYQISIDSEETPAISIPIDDFDSGDYTITIQYDTTTLLGVFNI